MTYEDDGYTRRFGKAEQRRGTLPDLCDAARTGFYLFGIDGLYGVNDYYLWLEVGNG